MSSFSGTCPGAGFSYEDLDKYGLNDKSYRKPEISPGIGEEHQIGREQIISVFGKFHSNNSFWKNVSPTEYLSEIKGAVQLHHAQDDEVVVIEYSRDLNSKLEKAGVDHQFYEYQSGGHNISGTSFNLAMKRTVDFYKNYLSSP